MSRLPQDDLPETPDDDVAEAEVSLDLDLGAEDEATPASLQRGVAVIRAHWEHAPKGPGVYRMIGEDGAVLYVGKAKQRQKTHRLLYARRRRAYEPHRAHDRADGLDGFRLDGDRDRGAAARSQSHQAA
jgi:hypothetical protein